MNAVKSIVIGLLCLSAGAAGAVGGAWNGPDAYLELLICDKVYTGAGELEFGPDWYDGSETRISYCCTPVVPYKSTSTITEDPGYAGNGDYDLLFLR